MTESKIDCLIPLLQMNPVFRWHPCISMTVEHRQAPDKRNLIYSRAFRRGSVVTVVAGGLLLLDLPLNWLHMGMGTRPTREREGGRTGDRGSCLIDTHCASEAALRPS